MRRSFPAHSTYEQQVTVLLVGAGRFRAARQVVEGEAGGVHDAGKVDGEDSKPFDFLTLST